MTSRATAAPISRRFHLRQHTASAHDVLDGMIGPWRERGDYIRYVQAIAGFRIPVEAVLAHFRYPADWGDFRPLLVSDALRRDAAALEVDPEPGGSSWTGGQDREALFGLLYTLEGSNLGARLLLKRAVALGFSASDGCAHLNQQADGLDHWRHYLELLEAAPELDMDRVCDAAVMAFDLARQSFERVACERC